MARPVELLHGLDHGEPQQVHQVLLGACPASLLEQFALVIGIEVVLAAVIAARVLGDEFVLVVDHEPLGVLVYSRSCRITYDCRATDITSGFSVIASNLPATPPLNSYSGTTAAGSGPWYYVIAVEVP
ncbi:MAG: hypothetical protein O2923_01905 [Verrucomicrobia bacterium]|nr:hypothetical protein [Verrucomicrobiota bacterium]